MYIVGENMKKKGFTLVELLVIVVVLGIISTLVLPQVGKSIKKVKEEQYRRIINSIENSAKSYYSENQGKLKISVEELQQNKYLSSNIKNPITDEYINGCVRVGKDSDGTNTYTYIENCTANTVTLTVNLNGGTAGQTFDSSYEEGTRIVLKDATKTGYNFNRWEVIIGDSRIIGNDLVIGSTGTTIYATYSTQPRLIINLDGGTISTTYNERYETGTIIDLENARKAGYNFTGWTIVSGNGVISGNKYMQGTTDTTIKANYTECGIGTYNDGNSSSCTACAAGTYSNSNGATTCIACATGSTSAAGASSCTACQGTTTSGTGQTSCNASCGKSNVATWNTATWNSSNNTVSNNCSIATCATGYHLSSNSCIANTYTVKYNSNNGSGSMSDDTFTYDQTYQLKTNAFSRTNYSFLGWSTNANSTTATYTDQQSVSNLTTTNSGTVNLYAIWQMNTFKVTLDKAGGSQGDDDVIVEYGKSIPTVVFPTKTGYKFNGYYTSSNGGGTKYINADGTSAKDYDFTSDETFYAYWTEDRKIWFTYTGKFKDSATGQELTGEYYSTDTSYTIWFITPGNLVPKMDFDIHSFLVGGGYRGGGSTLSCGNSTNCGGNGGNGGKIHTGSATLVKDRTYSISIGTSI